MIEDTEVSLMSRATIEEKNYQWEKAAKLYEQVADLFFKKKKLEDAANFFTKAGDIYLRAVTASETKDEYINRNNLSVEAFQKAENLYKKNNNELLCLECRVKANIASSLVASKAEKQKDSLADSINICLDLINIHSKKDEPNNFIKISRDVKAGRR